ncbi:hypothetical protein WJX73_000218 [Symbiochloris irregularis]|uniref:DNA/pantothenate metabolism flavoprotein C-terminal domain-containing protein n=1 Tax=Symbiochloris irregularis TaxID=706552 RepID=A0AAW1Q0M4_9CHLO
MSRAQASELPVSEEARAFLADCPTPTGDVEHRVEAFISQHRDPTGKLRRPIVCVTSGGTIVPLEKRCIRFIDNFSGGTRGALSTEYFLQEGYAVIFLNRKHSIQPFTKGLPSGHIMDCLTQVLDSPEVGTSSPLQNGHHEGAAPPSSGNSSGSSGDGGPKRRRQGNRHSSARAIVKQAVARASGVRKQGVLLHITFETLFEYLKFLEVIAHQLRSCGRQAGFYLAAAVSDFYIPWASMVEHKMQSTDASDGLTLHLRKVPKMLGVLRHHWAPEAFIVSFKLETDERILMDKARGAMERYGVHVVVANTLQDRKERVQLVQATDRLP